MDRIETMQAFVTVADQRGFAPAARKLGLSASAVTRMVAALEERVGARLLQRTTRSVMLTDAGERFLERARRILAGVEEAEGAVQAERTQPTGRLVVSAPLGFGRRHVTPLMSTYLKRYPDVAGDLRLSDRMVNLVEEGIDIAVRIGHLPDSSLVARTVGDAWRAASSSRDHGPSHRAFRRVERRAGLALCRERSRGSRRLRAALHHLHAEQGGGLTRVLAYQAAEGLAGGRLKAVLTDYEIAPLPIHLVYPTSRLLSAKVRAFVDLVLHDCDWRFAKR